MKILQKMKKKKMVSNIKKIKCNNIDSVIESQAKKTSTKNDGV